MTGAVVVHPGCTGTGRTEAGRAALRWAAAEARRRGAPLEVLVAGGATGEGSALSRALATVRAAVSGLPVVPRPAHGPLVDVLRTHSAEAAALVLPVGLPELASVVAESYCPVVAVPEFPEPEHGPVVVGVAPWTGEEVVELAFDVAEGRHAPLLAVRTWSDPAIDLGVLRSDRIARWDEAEDRARRELRFALSAWALVHPDVDVETMVAEDRAGELLVELSHRARLLVLGRSARGALLAGIAGSPVGTLMRQARCPVVVVPAEGPPRSVWLPAHEHGWAFTGR